MRGEFSIERVALHLVDRNMAQPGLATGEINLEVFDRARDREVLRNFFSGHLTKVWTTTEGRRTFAAKFDRSSVMRQYYQELSRDTSSFFERSCDIARRLHSSSQKRRASRGLLMVLWFQVSEDERPFLGLFKMDPGRSERVALQQDEAGPDPRDRVLKWAVIPHPTRRAFDVKAKDEQGGSDPAQYFIDFLDCKCRPSEKKHTEGFLRALAGYAQEQHATEDWRTAVYELVQELGDEPVITPDVVVKKVEETGVLESFQEQAFRKKLVDFEAEDLYISSSSLRAVKIQYDLSNGIVIRGPRDVMESLVQIVPVNGEEVEFRIRAASYRKNYV
jgi:nucleoid-associated protein YejK